MSNLRDCTRISIVAGLSSLIAVVTCVNSHASVEIISVALSSVNHTYNFEKKIEL